MAMADYRLCDRCEGKAFYDANLNYKFNPAGPVVRYAGEGGAHHALDYLGDWAVLCEDCAKTHRTMIVEIPTPSGVEGGGE